MRSPTAPAIFCLDPDEAAFAPSAAAQQIPAGLFVGCYHSHIYCLTVSVGQRLASLALGPASLQSRSGPGRGLPEAGQGRGPLPGRLNMGGRGTGGLTETLLPTWRWCHGFCVMGCGTRGQTCRLSWAPVLELREGVEGFPPRRGSRRRGGGHAEEWPPVQKDPERSQVGVATKRRLRVASGFRA